MLEVVVLALEGALASTITGPLDILGQAGVLWNRIHGREPRPPFNVRAASPGGQPVACRGGLVIQPHLALEDLERADLIIISAEDISPLDAWTPSLAPRLRELHAGGAALASICTGAFLLARTGLLEGRRATTHWGFAELFRGRHPGVRLVPDRLVVEENGLFTSGGAHSYLDLCLYLVERYAGFEVAVECGRSLLLDLGRRSQTPYAGLGLTKSHGDPRVLQAQEWLEENHHLEMNLEDLAREVGMSLRNLKRRFRQATGHTPVGYLQRCRVEASKRLLEQGGLGIEEVGGRAGYRDAAFFRQVFKRLTGFTPAEYARRCRSGRG